MRTLLIYKIIIFLLLAEASFSQQEDICKITFQLQLEPDRLPKDDVIYKNAKLRIDLEKYFIDTYKNRLENNFSFNDYGKVSIGYLSKSKLQGDKIPFRIIGLGANYRYDCGEKVCEVNYKTQSYTINIRRQKSELNHVTVKSGQSANPSPIPKSTPKVDIPIGFTTSPTVVSSHLDIIEDTDRNRILRTLDEKIQEIEEQTITDEINLIDCNETNEKYEFGRWVRRSKDSLRSIANRERLDSILKHTSFQNLLAGNYNKAFCYAYLSSFLSGNHPSATVKQIAVIIKLNSDATSLFEHRKYVSSFLNYHAICEKVNEIEGFNNTISNEESKGRYFDKLDCGKKTINSLREVIIQMFYTYEENRPSKENVDVKLFLKNFNNSSDFTSYYENYKKYLKYAQYAFENTLDVDMQKLMKDSRTDNRTFNDIWNDINGCFASDILVFSQKSGLKLDNSDLGTINLDTRKVCTHLKEVIKKATTVREIRKDLIKHYPCLEAK